MFRCAVLGLLQHARLHAHSERAAHEHAALVPVEEEVEGEAFVAQTVAPSQDEVGVIVAELHERWVSDGQTALVDENAAVGCVLESCAVEVAHALTLFGYGIDACVLVRVDGAP